MSEDVFLKLREQLDQYSIGFPATESGVELRVLRKIFTEEEASMFLDMSLILESPETVASRTGRDLESLPDLLEAMARKGQLFRHRGGESVRYAAVPFVIGVYEFQLNNMDRELAELTDAYLDEAFMEEAINKSVQPLRTVPVNRAVDVSYSVAPYEDARQIVKGKDKIAVAECLCRVQQGLLQKGCDKPKEVCMSFGSHADYYVENGMGRYVTREEALAILDTCEEAGLVNQPANTINPGGMCNCCGDCCGLLRAMHRHPKPADLVVTNNSAVVDGDLCVACETCIDRCQVAAVSIGAEDVAEVDIDRCIGCGLCVTTCEAEAMTLAQRPEGQRRAPPASGRDLMMETTSKRGTSIIPLAVRGK